MLSPGSPVCPHPGSGEHRTSAANTTNRHDPHRTIDRVNPHAGHTSCTHHWPR